MWLNHTLKLSLTYKTKNNHACICYYFLSTIKLDVNWALLITLLMLSLFLSLDIEYDADIYINSVNDIHIATLIKIFLFILIYTHLTINYNVITCKIKDEQMLN